MMKVEMLRDLRDVVEICESCELHACRTQTVFGRGSLDARIMFVGEAPGEREDEQGKPFVGPSGKLLDEIITQSMRLKPEDVYICNAVKCRPPDNRTPTSEEIGTCGEYLMLQVRAIQPEIIIALGKAATLALGCDTGRGWAGSWGSYEGIPVMPTYHPSYLLRQDNPKPIWKRVAKHLKAVLAKLS